jgi:hypothetical protein
LNYFRRDAGVLDPYNAFVAPRRHLDAQLRTMQAREERNYRQTQREIGQIRELETAPTGVAAGFMNHSQYFLQVRPAPRRR